MSDVKTVRTIAMQYLQAVGFDDQSAEWAMQQVPDDATPEYVMDFAMGVVREHNRIMQETQSMSPYQTARHLGFSDQFIFASNILMDAGFEPLAAFDLCTEAEDEGEPLEQMAREVVAVVNAVAVEE